METFGHIGVYADCPNRFSDERLERAFLEKVGGDCKVPAGIYAVPFLGHIEAVAFIGSPDGKEMYKRSLNGQTQDAKQLGESLAEALIADGGGRILEELRK
mgnify:CR=1 FL=1